MKKLTIANIEELLEQMSEVNHEAAVKAEEGSVDEAFFSGFATAIMIFRLNIRGFEE